MFSDSGSSRLGAARQKRQHQRIFCHHRCKNRGIGAGRKPSMGTHFSEVNDNFKIYKVNEHQHTPEIEQTVKQWNSAFKPITFSTHLVPMTRGIMATIYTELKDSMDAEHLQLIFSKFYKDSYFVRVRETGSFPATKEVYGSNFAISALPSMNGRTE